MKTKILLFTLLILSFQAFAGPKIKIRITLGIPPDCLSLSICRLEILSSEAQLTDANGHCYIDDRTGNLIMEIEEREKDPEGRLDGSLFVMSQGYVLPEKLCEALGLRRDYKIASGSYPMEHTDLIRKVNFGK